jgi:serine/threonine-protein kinase
MGEVFRARDTRLDRIVAVKILLPHLAGRADLRERFEREARAIASLNHPHICVLYDIGRQDGVDFLVMEYLEGEPLSRRMLKGPLPLEEVLQYAAEIADALDKAHGKGVTHRDLKPGNIMVTKSGTKLLDFGLAKLRQEAVPPAVPASQLPTLTNLPSAHGTIVGTLQYMAPEQLEGKEVDARTDIFAFGAVVYEMATGKKAFEGATQASLISAIMSALPGPISAIQPMTPVALDRVVRKCLAKEPDKRWQTASDLSDALKWIAQDSSEHPRPLVPQAPAPLPGKRSRAPALGRAAVALIALAGVALWLRGPAPVAPQQVSRFSISLAPGQRLAAVDQPQPALAISPDGSRLAYVANQGGIRQQVYVRNINSLDAIAIPESENGYNPFFAADGRSLAFFVEGTLKKVAVTGGTPVSVASLPRISLPMGGAWAADGSYILGFGNFPTLQRIPAGGSAPAPLTRLDLASEETSHMWPSLLPGDQAFLYTVFRGPNQPSKTVVRSLATGEQHELLTGGSRPIYVPSGHIVYADQGNLMAAPFDLKQLKVAGPAVAVLQGVMRCQQCGGGQFSISDNGVLVYIPEIRSAADRHLVWVDRAGKEQPIPAAPGTFGKPELSPDGQRIALGGEGQVRVYDIARDSFTQVAAGQNPTWSPDGQRIGFQRQVNGEFHVFLQKADGTGEAEQLTTGSNRHAPGAFSPDGQLLAYTDGDPVTGSDIWILRLADRQARPVITDPQSQSAPKFSPDGRWLVYVSDESGMREIYLRSSSGTGTKLKISTDGGVEALWNRNGREIFYRNGDQVLAVDVTTSPSLSAGKPHQLFSAQYLRAQGNLPNWDVSSDGQRFAMLKAVELNVTQVNVVLNWFEELRQRVPIGN